MRTLIWSTFSQQLCSPTDSLDTIRQDFNAYPNMDSFNWSNRCIDTNWKAYFDSGYAPVSSFKVTHDSQIVYDFEPQDTFSFGIGISFNINNK